jgi:hypothetical protein
MGVYDELSKLDSESPTPKVAGDTINQSKDQRIKSKPKDLVDQSTDQSTNRLTDWLTDSINDVGELGPVVERPRAFYITQKVDEWLDEAVRYLRRKGMHKVDRSVLINALLHNEGLFKPRFLNTISKILLAHLTNKSLKRAQSID